MYGVVSQLVPPETNTWLNPARARQTGRAAPSQASVLHTEFYFGSKLLSISVHMFSGSRAARGRRLLDFREDASDCRSNFLSPPSLHLSPPLFLVPHPAEELGNLHILETRAPASQSVSVCVFVRFRPRRILPAKEERTEKVVSDFARSVSFMVCSRCLPSLPPQFATPARPSLLRNNVGRFCATKPGKSNALRYGTHLEVLEQWRQENMRCEIQFFTRMRGTRNGVLTF